MPREPQTLVVDDGTPGRLLSIGDIVVGDAVRQTVAFTPELRDAFHVLGRDDAPVHGDVAFARARGFDAPIVQGLCVSTRFSRLIGMYLPGQSAVLEGVSFKYRRPVAQDAQVMFTATVSRVQAALRVVRLDLLASIDGRTCITGEAQCLLR